MRTELRIGRPMERGVECRGVREQIIVLRPLDGAAGAGEERLDVDAHERRRQQSDR